MVRASQCGRNARNRHSCSCSLETAAKMFRMLYLVALASAALYGAADFLGGIASRRTNTIAIVVISQLAGLIVLLLVLPLLPSSSATRNDFVWGAAAGFAGGIGVALLYRALAIGSMAIV